MIPGAGSKHIRTRRRNGSGNYLPTGDEIKLQQSSGNSELKTTADSETICANNFLIAGGGGWLNQSFQGERCLAAVANVEFVHRHKIRACPGAGIPLKYPVPVVVIA